MKVLNFCVIGLFFLTAACSTKETYRIMGNQFSYGDKDIAIVKLNVTKERMPMEHASPPTVKQTYFPFFYSRKNGVLKFEGYCDPIKYDGPFQPLDYDKLERLQSISSIEKSCKIKSLKLIAAEEAGYPMGGRGGPQNTIGMTANVFSPKTKQWERQSINFPDLP